MSRLLGIGERFPEFSVPAVVSREKGKEFTTITNKTIAGKWAVIFFWPMDFTFVCPTEIAEFKPASNPFFVGLMLTTVSCCANAWGVPQAAQSAVSAATRRRMKMPLISGCPSQR